MSNWSVDILRQSGWDSWVLICALGSVALATYVTLRGTWRQRRGWIPVFLAAIALVGTGTILAVPDLHSPYVGLVWTFVLLSAVAGASYYNLQPELGLNRTCLLLGMRLLTLALLVPMLFEPVLRRVSRPIPQCPLFLLVDGSGSMSVPDVQNGPSRIQAVWQILRPQIDRIADHFVPRYFVFSTQTQELNKPEDLARQAADGKATDIVQAVRKVLSGDIRGPGAIVLVSDGIDNTSPNVADALRSSPVPIHTVRVGSEQAESSALVNVAVDNVEAAEDFVVNHASMVRVTVKSSALANRVVDVKLCPIDAQGRPADKETVRPLVLQPLASGQMVEIPFTARTAGVQRLAVWIDPVPGERSLVDNRQEFQGLALEPRIKVLYIEGRVRPEYTQLNRALARDPNIELASLLRIAVDRFAASGTVEGQPLSAIPATPEQWRQVDVIILGDLDSSFLTKIQQAMIEQRVLEGAGLLMIGGQNNFGPGGYRDTAIEKALPVLVGDPDSPQERTPFVPALTPEGASHPAMEGLAEWFGPAEDPARRLPPLRGNVVIQRPKAGAQVLLEHRQRLGPDGKPQVVLAVQRYGQGRSAAFTADTTYLWYLPLRGMGQDSPYNRLWGQLIRWLADADVRNRQRGPGVDGLLSKNTYSLGQNVRVRAMVRDLRGDATRYAQVHMVVSRPDGTDRQQIPLNPVETRTGLYDGLISAPDKGEWIIELSATKEGAALGTQQLRFTVIPPADEMLKLAANHQLLRAISEQTRGFSFDLAQLPDLIDQLIRSRPADEAERQETLPLANTVRAVLAMFGGTPDWPSRYDLPMEALLVVVLLTAEWMLRRRWQLP